MNRIVVAMSGGVDSSIAALLLKEEGYEVIGVSMKLFEGSRCCTVEDVRDAKEASALGGFPHYTVNFKEVFKKEVVGYFVKGHLMGETPNPCILCNQEVKFKALLKRARELDANLIATGHYARVEQDSSSRRWLLKKGKDLAKDQSYFLATLPQDILKHIRFPLGDLTKEDVREIARRKGLRFSEKEESQELCFIPDGGYYTLIQKSVGAIHAASGEPRLRRELPLQKGEIVNNRGEVLGHHSGIVNYTIGQRRGLGISVGKPLYVTQLDPMTNRVIVGEDRDLFKKDLIARDVNWIFETPFTKGGRGIFIDPITVHVKIRSRHEGAKAIVEPLSTTGIPACENSKVRVIFDEPQRAITPGQLVAFYDGDVVLGGGWITDAIQNSK